MKEKMLGRKVIGSGLGSLVLGETISVMKDIPDGSIDMILCDLPYGTTRNKWDSIVPLDMLWEQYERIIKDNGAIVLTAQTPFDKVLGSSNLKLLRYEWVWIKNRGTGHLNAKKMPLKNHENILVFYKKLPTYNPQMTVGKPYVRRDCGRNSLNKGNYGKVNESHTTLNGGYRYPLSATSFNSVERTVHPTQKPVALMEYLIETYTNEGELVLDNTMGSGTTCVAAINIGRRYLGIELDENYYDIAVKRVDEAIKNKEETE